MRRRFRGEISGFGTATGHRVVIGHWPSSPYGPFADVMFESPDGHRILLAPDEAIAAFVSTTYEFDEVLLVDVRADRDDAGLTCRAGELEVRVDVGARTALGRMLRLVPRRIAESPIWCTIIDPVANVVMKGVRTRGSAGNERREWYGATDQHAIDGVRATWRGQSLGALADVWPPVNFGFSSTPRRPSTVAVTTTIDVPDGIGQATDP